jgi:streptogramin lyase
MISLTLVGGATARSASAAPGSTVESRTAEGSSSLEPLPAARREISLTPSTTEPYTPCPPAAGLAAECNMVIDPALVRTASGYQLPSGAPLVGGTGVEGGFSPKDLQSAYALTKSGGTGQTVAVVDAYGDKAVNGDLAEYRKEYKLGECTEANKCFKKVNVLGVEGSYPKEGPEIWGAETALDVEMVSAVCEQCHILLVEANGEKPAEMAAAEEAAAKWEEAGTKLKATEISNSYGYHETNESVCPSKKGCKEYLAAYNHPGVPVTVASGDTGYDDGGVAPNWPASSPNVIAVGGTVLEKAEGRNPRGWEEEVWADSGSGCSLYESKPSWQTDEACAKRMDNDIAAVAEELSIYSTPYMGGWGDVGGTSASAPLIAGIEALSGSSTRTLGAEAFYTRPHMLFRITRGSNGTCGASEAAATWYECHATAEGYDGPAGWGTPDGAFSITAAPLAISETASGVSLTGATLNGTVDPEGLTTKYYFEYGETTAYGTKTTEASAGAGTSEIAEGAAISGLTSGTGYHFRVVATNGDGTMRGEDQTFTAENVPENTALPVASPAAPDQAVPESTTNGSWTNAPTRYEYQWERCNAAGGECVSIAGANGSSYTPVAADVEHTLVIKVTASNGAGAASALSSATGKVKAIGQISEYSSCSSPQAIAPGPDGDVWFSCYKKIAKITMSGAVTEYAEPSANVLGIVAGPDGNLWFTERNGSKIAKITTSGAITEYALPAGSEPMRIAVGPDKDLWFTEAATGKVAKISTSGAITEYTLPSGSWPVGIAAGSDGNMWFTDDGTNRVGKISTSGAITEYALPGGSSGPRGIVAGPDGDLWFTLESAKIEKITTSGVTTAYALPEGGWSEAIVAAPDGDLWFAEQSANKLGRITTAGTVTEFALPKESSPEQVAVGPDENVWFSAFLANKVGRITP